jgi:hypothetical protein
VHRWFVAPVEPVTAARPIGFIGQLEGTTLEDLPGLPYGLDDDELMIEWGVVPDVDSELFEVDEVDETDDLDADAVAVDSPQTITPVDVAVVDDLDVESTVSGAVTTSGDVAELDDLDGAFDPDSVVISFDLAELTDGGDAASSELMLTEVDEASAFDSGGDVLEESDLDIVDLDTADIDTVDIDSLEVDTTEVDTADVEMVDVDIAVEPDLIPSDRVEADESVMERSEPASADEPAESDEQPDDFEFAVVWPDGREQPAEMGFVESSEPSDSEPMFTETDEGELHFSMPPLVVSDDAAPAGEVPDDVAAAVRRAIAAIESASIGDSDGSWDATLEMTDADLSDFDAETLTDVGGHERDAPVEAPSMGFAPPTMDMRAEVLYGEVSADGSAADSGMPDDGSDERESALRRLIGGLRRKDH